MKTQIRITISILILLISCEGSKDDKISYGFDVRPILSTSCFSCHSSENNSSANLNLSSYETLMYDTSDNGPVIIPKYPENSFLIDKIANPIPSFGSTMPINLPPLSVEEIRIIEA